MAIHEFWDNVWQGARLAAVGHVVDRPNPDIGKIEQSIRATQHWLSAKHVQGFNEKDFSFLPQAERRKLAELVKRYLNVASKIHPLASPPQEQVDQAIPPFLKIVELLEFHRYADAEAYRIGKQVENFIRDYRPAFLADLRFETGADQTGDPAISMWAILEDAAVEESVFRANANRVYELLRVAVRSVEPKRWPYVSLRTVSEQAELLETPAA
ncbi:MAG: hypothetical protein K2R98_10320 [Gemmataceae bacterium]|nr:hypothetical protein [Gemmataceae bacterium]